MAGRKSKEEHPADKKRYSYTTYSVRPSKPFVGRVEKIAAQLGVSEAELGRRALEALVTMVESQEPSVPAVVTAVRALRAANATMDAEERRFAPQEPTRTASRADFRDQRSVTLVVFDEVPCGWPKPVWRERAIGDVEVPSGKYPDHAFGLLASGDSMNKARLPGGRVGIYEGNVLICQCPDKRAPQSGDIVVANVHGEFTVKRLTGDGLAPESTNRRHRSPKLPDEGIKIVAVVVDAISTVVQKLAR